MRVRRFEEQGREMVRIKSLVGMDEMGEARDEQARSRREHEPIATSPTISEARSQSRPMISLLPPSFKMETRLVCEAAMAGTMPKIKPATSETNTANESTRGSTPASAARGTLSPIRDRTAGVQRKARAQPASPPIVLRASSPPATGERYDFCPHPEPTEPQSHAAARACAPAADWRCCRTRSTAPGQRRPDTIIARFVCRQSMRSTSVSRAESWLVCSCWDTA